MRVEEAYEKSRKSKKRKLILYHNQGFPNTAPKTAVGNVLLLFLHEGIFTYCETCNTYFLKLPKGLLQREYWCDRKIWGPFFIQRSSISYLRLLQYVQTVVRYHLPLRDIFCVLVALCLGRVTVMDMGWNKWGIWIRPVFWDSEGAPSKWSSKGAIN